MTDEKGVPVKVGAELVPAGVKETVPFVPAGVPALTAEVVALEPVKVWAAAVRVATVGVTVLAPPVPPTSPLAARVPRGIAAFNDVTSV
jgi:hypothetical protein